MANSNKEWEKWGELDPLFGVASWTGREREGDNPWTDEDFYDLGLQDWRDFQQHWRRYGLNQESCLEIGCGAGRITMQLAKVFQVVYAIDVSEKMIAYAKSKIASPSVTFLHSDGVTLDLAEESVSAVFSTHVFQHFDSLEHASVYFSEISKVLKPGGTVMIHLPIYNWPSMHRVFDFLYRSRKQVADAKATVRRWLMAHGMAEPFMRGLQYSVSYIYTELPRHGFNNIEIVIFPTSSNGEIHSFVFATKEDTQNC